MFKRTAKKLLSVPLSLENKMYHFTSDLEFANVIEEQLKKVPVSNGSRYYDRINKRLGIICDSFLYHSFKNCCELIYITPQNFEVQLRNIDVLLITSTWHGLNHESVPTPYDKFSKKVDAVYVIAAVKDVMKVAPQGATVVIESTISPGTIDKFIRPVVAEANRGDLNLVHAPERIIPGNMVYELLHNNRTIGADDKTVGEKVKEFYSSFCQGEIVVTDIRTAEMTKVVENTFRAVNIAFANELAKICRHDNMDVYEIIKICNMHPRVNILQPGPGVGGHCISVDPWFLVGDYPSLAKVIDESMKTNDGMPDFVLNRIYEIMKENGLTDTSRVGLYGLTYKENVDDMRESPTLQLLASQRHHLAAPLMSYDPFITKDAVPNQKHDLDEFLDACDLVVVMVKHDEIKENMSKLNGKIILDCHNIIKGLPNVYHI